MYRSSLGGTAFSSLVDYPIDFFRFVKESIMIRFEKDQKDQVAFLANQLLSEAKKTAVKNLKEAGQSSGPITLDEQIPVMYGWLEAIERDYSPEKKAICEGFVSYSIDDFKLYCGDLINELLLTITSNRFCPKGFSERFIYALYNILRSTAHIYLPTTELIFWGYGEQDVFPSYHSFVISASIDGMIKWTRKSKYEVSNSSPACVEPFAQTDVSNTVVRGIDDNLRRQFYSSNGRIISLFKQEIVAALTASGAPKKVVDVIGSIDTEKYSAVFQKGMDQFIQANYVQKLVDTVNYLSKEDIADMAESLVRMTCLKRHITTDEETVGGPVDVAVITKGDGFIWLKRKHYFTPEINHHFFERRK